MLRSWTFYMDRVRHARYGCEEYRLGGASKVTRMARVVRSIGSPAFTILSVD